MTPGKLNIDIYQFATFSLPLQWSAGGVPVDLTGCKIRMQIRERASSSVSVISLSTESGGIVINDAAAGKFTTTITDEKTGALLIKAGVHDIVVESAGGESYRLLEGAVAVHPGVTRP